MCHFFEKHWYNMRFFVFFLCLSFRRTVPHLLQCPVGVGAHPVQFVDEREKGDIVALHLPVDCHGLTLNSSHRAQHQHGAVQHSQCSLHLNSKVHVAWRSKGDSDIWRQINNSVFARKIWCSLYFWHLQSVIAAVPVKVNRNKLQVNTEIRTNCT